MAVVSLVTVKVCIDTTVMSSDRDRTFHLPLQATAVEEKSVCEFKSNKYLDVLWPSQLFFLEEQLKKIAKQQPQFIKKAGSKQRPKGGGGNGGGPISLVASMMAAKLKEECNKSKQHFLKGLAENKVAIDQFTKKIGLAVKDFDIKHIWQPSIKSCGKRLAGGHSTLFQ
jgi:hypothetical protein